MPSKASYLDLSKKGGGLEREQRISINQNGVGRCGNAFLDPAGMEPQLFLKVLGENSTSLSKGFFGISILMAIKSHPFPLIFLLGTKVY